MTSGPDDPYQPYGPHHTETLGTGHKPPRRRRHLTGLLAVAVIALAGGGGIAYVALHSGSNVNTVASRGGAQSPSPKPSGSAEPRHRHGLPDSGDFGGFGGFRFGGAIHGQLTVPKRGGGYQTLAVQSGTVSAVSSSSITVKSADGFSKTYTVARSTEVNAQAAGIGTVKTGDSVVLTATISGGKTTAASIFDLTSIRSSHEHFDFPDGAHGSGQN